jgi:hypothetical protein
MRPATLALGLLALAGGAVGIVAWRNATEESRAWARLLTCADRDLPLDDPNSNAEVQALFDRFGGPECDRGAAPFRALRLLDGTGDEWIVLLRLVPVVGFGQELLWADLVGPDRLERSDRFLSRLHDVPVRSASVFRRPNDPVSYLRIDSIQLRRAVPAVARFYAIDRGTPVLVRAETGDSTVHRVPGPPIAAPTPLLRDPAAWEADLRSGPPPRLLAALAYLDGIPPLPGDPIDSSLLRIDGENRFVAEARAHPGVRARVLELRRSPAPWIREAAEAVPLDGSR